MSELNNYSLGRSTKDIVREELRKQKLREELLGYLKLAKNKIKAKIKSKKSNYSEDENFNSLSEYYKKSRSKDYIKKRQDKLPPKDIYPPYKDPWSGIIHPNKPPKHKIILPPGDWRKDVPPRINPPIGDKYPRYKLYNEEDFSVNKYIRRFDSMVPSHNDDRLAWYSFKSASKAKGRGADMLKDRTGLSEETINKFGSKFKKIMEDNRGLTNVYRKYGVFGFSDENFGWVDALNDPMLNNPLTRGMAKRAVKDLIKGTDEKKVAKLGKIGNVAARGLRVLKSGMREMKNDKFRRALGFGSLNRDRFDNVGKVARFGKSLIDHELGHSEDDFSYYGKKIDTIKKGLKEPDTPYGKGRLAKAHYDALRSSVRGYNKRNDMIYTILHSKNKDEVKNTKDNLDKIMKRDPSKYTNLYAKLQDHLYS